MKVLFVTPELGPWMKSGGLGEISSSLPAALLEAGVDVRTLVPAYAPLLAAFPAARLVAELAPAGGELAASRLLEAKADNGVPLLMLDCPAYFRRSGTAYLDADGNDFGDNHLRFGLLSRIAALLGSEASPLRWRPDILHCNDWPCGLAPAHLHFMPGKKSATVMSIHNLAFQGIFPADVMPALGLPAAAFSIDGVEFWGQLSFMKAGLHYADRLTTVSPRYAEEIQTEEFGYGFAGLLRWRREHLSGILNGIDTHVWNPATDPALPRRYEFAHLHGKGANRAALRARFGLEDSPAVPLLGNVGRITHQKGLDLLAGIIDDIAALPAQLVLLGTGDRTIEASLLQAAARHPGRVAVDIGFDDGLAHLIEAGADMFLMPSRFEPCGLNQMYSLRYGTPPIVRQTGGLADSVVDCTPATLADNSANGFSFGPATGEALLAAIRRAVGAWQERAVWRKLQRSGMRMDFAWQHAAARYQEVYTALAAERKAAGGGRARPATVRRRGTEAPAG